MQPELPRCKLTEAVQIHFCYDKSMLNILITSNISDGLAEKIQAVSKDITLFRPDDIEKQPELIEDIEVLFGNTKAEYWEQATSLKWHQSTHAGVANLIRKPAIKSHSAVITNIHIHPVPMAEHALGLMIMLTRNIDVAYQQQLNKTWDRKHIRDDIGVLYGKTLGVIGLGAVGSRVAELGQALGMNIIGIKRTPDKRDYPVLAPSQKHELLKQSDFVVIVTPDTNETYQMIGKDEFKTMKPSSFIINIGRGAAIDTDALINALKKGIIAGAGLDVVDPEPLPSASPLWDLPKVIITPHSSADSLTYLEDATEVFIGNLKRYIAGEQLINVIDRELGY